LNKFVVVVVRVLQCLLQSVVTVVARVLRRSLQRQLLVVTSCRLTGQRFPFLYTMQHLAYGPPAAVTLSFPSATQWFIYTGWMRCRVVLRCLVPRGTVLQWNAYDNASGCNVLMRCGATRRRTTSNSTQCIRCERVLWSFGYTQSMVCLGVAI